ncbi:MAG: hypothetical protein WCK92_15275 [Bacteroidota bacterium]
MKTAILGIPFLLVSWIAELNAQVTIDGIYLSANDFINHKLSFKNSKAGNTYQLCADEQMNSSCIKILAGNDMIRLKKDSIFGYRNNKHNSFRFYKKTAYEILNPSEPILIYCSTPSTTTATSYSEKIYYFSLKPFSPVYPLTMRNLELVFNKDDRFKKLLEAYFHSDDELSVFDSVHKMYFLNRIHDESKLESTEYDERINEYKSKCGIFY